MKITFTAEEERVIGALLEKEITTPDQYPLSLNALVNACNQKSNRDPVMDLDELTVQNTLDGLKKRHLVGDQSGYGSRVTKYRHRFCNSEFGGLQLKPAELAILCELLLRGPQTPGQLRTHGERLQAFTGIEDVEAALIALMERDEPLVQRLPREPGKRETRYHHRLGSEPIEVEPEPSLNVSLPDDLGRLERLELEVEDLRRELERLRVLIEGAAGAAVNTDAGPD
jgi:uncharacterized protein